MNRNVSIVSVRILKDSVYADARPITLEAIANALEKTYGWYVELIHDPFDKILPISNSKAVVDSNKNSRLVLLEGIGHTRILWNEKTLIEIRKILSISQPEINVDSVEVTLN